MKLKYETQHKSCPTKCPPASAFASSRAAYRFTTNDPPTADDFVPMAILFPSRDFGANECASYGLSFFTSEAKAKAKYRSLKSVSKQFPWKHIGETQIGTADGLMTKSTGGGHFTLHEAHSAALHLKTVCCGPCV